MPEAPSEGDAQQKRHPSRGARANPAPATIEEPQIDTISQWAVLFYSLYFRIYKEWVMIAYRGEAPAIAGDEVDVSCTPHPTTPSPPSPLSR